MSDEKPKNKGGRPRKNANKPAETTAAVGEETAGEQAAEIPEKTDDQDSVDEPVAEASASDVETEAASEEGFDKSRPYATLHGGETRARYQQNGKFYDACGVEVTTS